LRLLLGRNLHRKSEPLNVHSMFHGPFGSTPGWPGAPPLVFPGARDVLESDNKSLAVRRKRIKDGIVI
jgi:hypothetical protein